MVTALLVHFPLEHVRQPAAARRREDVAVLVVEADVEHMTVVAELDGDAAGTDHVDVAELHSLVELEVPEDAEQNLEEPIHHASRYATDQENATRRRKQLHLDRATRNVPDPDLVSSD